MPRQKKMQANKNVGEVVTLLIPPEDIEIFWKRITDAGFPQSKKGVYDYIMADVMEEEDWDAELPPHHAGAGVIRGAVNEWAERNPEQWSEVKRKGSVAIQSLVSKLMKKL
jgi:hypothetical protein